VAAKFNGLAFAKAFAALVLIICFAILTRHFLLWRIGCIYLIFEFEQNIFIICASEMIFFLILLLAYRFLFLSAIAFLSVISFKALLFILSRSYFK
jgi:hypothetical protein